MAIATNKFQMLCANCTSLARFAREGKVVWRYAVPMALVGAIGSFIGSNAVLAVSSNALVWITFFVLPIMAVVTFRKFSTGEDDDAVPPFSGRSLATACACTFLCTLYDGFYGPGAGTLVMLSLMLFARFGLVRANALSKTAILVSNFTATVVFAVNGQIAFPLALFAAVFAVVGSYIGSGLVLSKGARFAKPCIIFAVALFMVKVLADQMPLLFG